FDLRNATLADLTTDANITIANGQTGRLAGTVINDGTIALESTGGATSLIISGDTTLGGSGTLTMNNQSPNRVYGSPGDSVLTHGADHTIRGASSNFGLSGNLTLNNLGTIEADGSAGLNMSLRSGETHVNSGTLRALSDSTLTLRNTFDNDGGLIEAQDNALVDMIGARIEGGTLNTAGTGVMQLSSSATIDGVTNLGRVEVSNGQTGRIAGNITNNGEIVIDAGANNTDLLVNGDTTLGGTGTLVMADTIRSRLYAGVSPTLLTNAAGHTIRGGGGIGDIGGNELGLRNEGLIEADGNTALTIKPNSDLNPSVNTGTLRASGSGGMVLTGAAFDNQGLVEAVGGSSVVYTSGATTLNNQAGTLTGGTWRVAGNGSEIEILGGPVVTNNAEINLEGAGSAFNSRTNVSTTTALEDSLTTNQGTLRVLDNRDYTTSNDLTNSGLLQLGGGTLNADSLTNTADGTLTGYGTVTPRPVNSGLIEATGGTLAMTGGIQGGSGTVTIASDGALDLSSATQDSSADFLNHQGTASDSLNLGSNDFIVSKDYTNANTGTGNAFDARANVVGTGQIVGENADMGITGDVTTAGTNTVTLDLGNVRGGTSTTVDYQIANTGTGADIRGAVQTAARTGNLTDARLSGTGVTAQNFGPIEAGQDSGNLTVTFDATSGGSLDGQTIGVVSNFDNVAGQTIEITGMATSLAEGSATPAGPIDLGNFRVGQAGPSQSFDVANLTTGAGAEKLGIGTTDATGNFAATNNLGAGLIDGGASQTNALSAAVNNGQAGVNTGALDIQYTTDGTDIDAGFTAQNVNTQSIALSATGYNMAQGSATPDPVTLANQRVGGTESQALTVSNTAPSGTFTEGLNVEFGANTGEAVNNAGTIGLLAGGGSNNSSMSVGVDTTAAGARTGSVRLNYETDGTGTSGLAAESVGSQTITVSGNVYQVAEGNLNITSLNFGVVQVGESVSQNLSISNIAAGPNGFVEDLNAQFGAASGTGSNLISGSGSISGLVAGATDTSSMEVNVNTASAGTLNGAIAVDYFSAGAVNGLSNGLGILAVGSQDFGVVGSIETTATVVDRAAPVINNGQPIVLGNVREGAVSPTAFVSVTNQASGNQQAALDATITGNAPITASGSFDDLGPGATDTNSLQVGMNTATAGAIAGTATIGFVSDAGNLGGGQLTLASQDIQVEGAVYRLASPEVDTTQPVVLAARVGDAAPTQNISVTNQSLDAFTEGLKADIGSVDAGFTGSGNIDNLAAGGTDTTSLALGLADTSSSQNISGTVNLDFQSTGAGTTEAADIAVGSEAIQVEGRVYQQAEAQVDTPSVDFGIVHVGDLISAKTVSVTNSALAAALNDTLAGGFLNLPAGPFDGSGSLTGLEVGQSDNSSLAIGLDTSSAGIFDLSGDYLQFASQNPDMDDLDLGTFGLDLFAQVNNYANPWFTLDSSLGTQSVSGYDFVVDFGTLLPDFGTLNTLLSFSNNVTGPADLLRGSYDLTGVGAPFTTSGFGDFNDLGAGDSVSNLSLAFNTSDLGFGIFQESIGLSAVGFNASGFEESFDISLTFRGTIRDTAAVSEPRVLLLLLPGLLALVGLQYRSAARQG
ncbi:choice-of-anchor D domain-containing protein, partial [Lamprobacter modestohalophilus]|uniref:beta strand repeat-containing protein n=1 Tax=Lamprobacter modestohalophilus TaxID=1064514 RepID=UPI002ADEDEE8